MEIPRPENKNTEERSNKNVNDGKLKYRSWCWDNPSDYLHDSINKNAASAVTLSEINFHIKGDGGDVAD